MAKASSWWAMSVLATVAGHAALAQTPIPPAPKDFVLAASESDRYEILAASLAIVQSQDARVRTFAQGMIRDHTRLADALRRAVTAAGLPQPAPGLSGDQAALLGSLQSMRGLEFDRAYARQQELVHAQAIAVEGSFAATGAEQNLRQAAEAALPTLQDHLEAARRLSAALGGS